jgi:conjugal transfer pilin signal peptidase TrbI
MNAALVLRVVSSQLRETLAHMRQRSFVYAPLALIWALAYVRVFIDPTPRIPLLFNVTSSLPYRVAWLAPVTQSTLRRGDYVLYRFEGAATADYPGLARQPFFKVIRGLPGDAVTVSGRNVFVGSDFIGRAKTATFDGRPLDPIAPTIIPQGFLFVQGASPDSFDSRYAASGLVRQDQLLGRVIPWF